MVNGSQWSTAVKRRATPVKGGWQGLLAVGQDLDFAFLAVADAFGANALAPVQVKVDDPAVGGGHRFQGDAAAGLGDAVGDAVGHFAQGVLPTLAILFHIQGDADVGAAQLMADDALDEKLKGLKGLPPASDEQAGIGAVDVDDGSADEFVVFGTQGYGYFGASGVEDAGYGVEGNAGGGVVVRGVVIRGELGAVGVRGAGIRGVRNGGGLAAGGGRRFRPGFRFRRGFGGGGDGGEAGNADFGQFAADAEEPLASLI